MRGQGGAAPVVGRAGDGVGDDERGGVRGEVAERGARREAAQHDVRVNRGLVRRAALRLPVPEAKVRRQARAVGRQAVLIDTQVHLPVLRAGRAQSTLSDIDWRAHAGVHAWCTCLLRLCSLPVTYVPASGYEGMGPTLTAIGACKKPLLGSHAQ